MTNYCGLDFGTSNSTFSIIHNAEATLVPLESGKLTLPSAIFFNFDDDKVFFGRSAIEEYVEGEFGRLMRSLKSVLGTSLMNDATQIKRERVAFIDIISKFLTEMKVRAEKHSGKSFEQVVMGRPVHFIDDNPVADMEAQNALEKAAKAAGFKEILFQYEPIAAALDYECKVVREEIALIVDLGGGTSDFSVVRISPDRISKENRKEDILANGGVHIGGTDFDRKLSLHSVMPHFGYRTKYKGESQLDMPNSYYHDLATWHRIHLLYAKKSIIALKNLAPQMQERHLIDRLIGLIERKEGHRLAIEVEKAKIALTTQAETLVNLDFVDGNLDLKLTCDDLHSSIINEVDCIIKQVKLTVSDAGLMLNQITKVFMTGGSTAIPLVRNSITELFPETEIVNGDMFGSVGLGLAVDAQRKFA